MRLFIVGVAVFLVTTAGVAQQPSRWTLSAGPEWSRIPSIWGLRVRADYDLVGRNSPFRVGLLAGGSWGPTQAFRDPIGSGSYYSGVNQRLDLTFGVTTALTPLPRARVSPYFTFGVVARQVWINGTSVWESPITPSSFVERSHTVGQITSTMGWGIRARIARRLFQVEIRTLYDVRFLTIGTSLPFE